ncbi:hypothetical protein [Piscinibacter sp.]|uniref:hypothetical protein n=1 Tax=Piscinibacter sp. TaxID=1903157 RepID=UPI002ED2AFD8
MDILQQYAARPTDTHEDFDEVARQVSPDVLGDGLAQAMRSDKTPPFENMVGQLFGQSNGQQRAGLLAQLVRSLGPGLLSSIAGGVLGRLGQGGAAGAEPRISPADAEQVTADQVKEIAAAAEKKDPGVLDRIGAYYAQHPDVVKVLGGSALAIALGQIANRMKR